MALPQTPPPDVPPQLEPEIAEACRATRHRTSLQSYSVPSSLHPVRVCGLGTTSHNSTKLPCTRRGLKVPLGRPVDARKRRQAPRCRRASRVCSASFVSADGLLLTNHHCAYRAIQRNSSPEHDYLNGGFVAKNRSDELPGHGTLVYVFQTQSDVTTKVLDGLEPSLSDLERLQEIERRESALVKACEHKPNTRCEVARENHGLRFLLLENLELRDVRVVAAPPEALGNYGGEIDNWHRPRHTLDFTLMRAYVSPDGKPADYDEKNVPFRPERHLHVSAEFPSPPDFVMVAGTPARTKRYATSVEVHDARTWYYPTRDGLFSAWIGALEQAAGDDPKAKLTVASWGSSPQQRALPRPRA